MLHLHRTPLFLLGLSLLVLLCLFQAQGLPKPAAHWQWMDIAGEGGTALMAAVWLGQILSSRPRGRVTMLLALGLGGLMLGSWADCLDEFYRLPEASLWDNWLESTLSPLGMLLLTAGLYFWREEQFSLSEQLHRRERLFREHRAFDRLTQLADAGYLREQIRLEQARCPGQPCALVLLDIDRFHAINRELGAAEGDRLLQALGHLLLLNLRNDDLLCRYAADRYAILLPETGAAEAQAMAEQLRASVAQLAYYPRRGGARLPLSARVVCALADSAPDALLAALNAALEPPPMHFHHPQPA